MKLFFIFIIAALSITPLDGYADSYASYKSKAEIKAKSLVRSKWADKKYLTNFKSISAGAFEFQLIDKHSNTSERMFILSDLETLIEGRIVKASYGENAIIDNKPAKQSKSAALKEAVFNNKLNLRASSANPIALVKEQNLKMFERVQSLKTINIGKGSKEVYVFVDHECSACVQVHKQFKQHSDSGVVFKLIPTGMMSDESKAKTIFNYLQETDEDMLQAYEDYLGPTKLIDIVQPNIDLATLYNSPEYKRAAKYLINNISAFYQLKKPATPTAVYLTEDGPIVHTILKTGPKSVESLIKKVVEKNELHMKHVDAKSLPVSE